MVKLLLDRGSKIDARTKVRACYESFGNKAREAEAE